MSTPPAYGALTCTWCEERVSPHQAVTTKSCGAPECERKRTAALAKTETQRHLHDHDQLVARMRDQCADMLDAGASILQTNAVDLQVAVVPYNRKPLTRLPADRRAAFEAHLRKIAEEGFAIDAPEIHTSKYIRMAIDQPEANVTNAACATCRGDCCKAGGPSWGFTDETTVCRFRVAYPDAALEDFIAYYLDHLPERSVDGNCVYQSQTGCTLARKDRADLCNSFLCRGVNRLLEEDARSSGRSAAIIAQHQGVPQAIGLFDAGIDTLSEVLPIVVDA